MEQACIWRSCERELHMMPVHGINPDCSVCHWYVAMPGLPGPTTGCCRSGQHHWFLMRSPSDRMELRASEFGSCKSVQLQRAPDDTGHAGEMRPLKGRRQSRQSEDGTSGDGPARVVDYAGMKNERHWTVDVRGQWARNAGRLSLPQALAKRAARR